MRKVYQLIQQTPMLHFQARDPGAVLRASEVKPKLDRFLVEYYRRYREGKDLLKEHADWKASSEHNALDYRMTIQLTKPAEVLPAPDPQKDRLGLYFGNMGVKEEEKKIQVVFSSNEIELKILCFHEGLEKLIQESLSLFFLLYNFGTRQDKGFGGFVLKGSQQQAEMLLADWYKRDPEKKGKSIYKLECKYAANSKNKLDVLYNIDVIYRVLKNGLNESFRRRNNPQAPYCYVKAYLTKYFLDKEIGGEKRFMKEKNIGPTVITQGKKETDPVNKYRYIRGLLGISDGQEWKEANYGKRSIKIKSMDDDIARIPSPILFKLAGDMLFILPNEPDETIYGKEFEFSSPTGCGKLCIPQKDEFDMDEMFQGFVEYINSTDVRQKLQKLSKQPKFVIERKMIMKGGAR